VPGLLTSAHLALRLLVPAFEPVVTPFDRIEAAVQSGDIEFGLLIHEGQLTFANSGLHLVADLGRWWQERTGLPLPLGGNAVRKDLGSDVSRLISGHLRASIDYALGHRADALAFSSRFARGLNLAQTDTFVGMYVNQWTLDLGEKGRRAVREFLAQGAEAGLVPSGVAVEFVAD
jgi:1,4-dihydroxy-6-naphthoate synthase